MKKIPFAILLVISFAVLASAQSGDFAGIEKVMDRPTYERAGLSKLTPEERAVLDEFLRGYVAGKQKDAAAVAAAEAVDRAVKERKVRPPDVFESRIVGTFKGFGLRTLFPLENGQVWKPTNDAVATYSPIESPRVIVFRDMFGYRMFIEGAETIRVKRVK